MGPTSVYEMRKTLEKKQFVYLEIRSAILNDQLTDLRVIELFDKYCFAEYLESQRFEKDAS